MRHCSHAWNSILTFSTPSDQRGLYEVVGSPSRQTNDITVSPRSQAGHMLGDHGALLEWQCADIQDSLLLRTTRICNVYVRPGASAPVDAWLVELVSRLRPDIIGGDLNARHERWSPAARLSATQTFARGDKILAFLEHTLYRTSSQRT
ncbi:Endonuclease-reverse transcriptase [Novymonas esmeraldas]|uniref:Endonuclease-reverse transcriptase n=1 Tax=Novymonas esmeraldas TaxID=1808958 RepID=A0AAW0F0K9_9TRYP